jgi:adenylyltransferase/sulfurtransferase
MKHKIYKTRSLKQRYMQKLNYNQAKIVGFDLEVFQAAKVAVIGAGAIGSHVCLGLVRKGIGVLDIFDDDVVEAQNLTRQLFSSKDLRKNKAVRLAKLLVKHGFFKTSITGYPYRFQEALEMGFDFSQYNIILTLVDNNPTRIAAAKYCLQEKIPLVTSAVSRDGNQLYCAIQKPGKACFGCIQPNAVNDNSYPCDLPGIIDVIMVVAGFTVFALDTIILERHQEWNYRSITLDGFMPDAGIIVPQNENCQICGQRRQQ